MKQLDPKAVWLFTLKLLPLFAIFAWFAGSIITMGAVTFFVSMNTQGDPTWIFGFLGSSFFFWIVLTVGGAYCWARLSYHYYRYELTEQGFKKESGVIWKRYVTIPYDRIQNVDIYRGIIARILGLSDLQIQTAGYSAPNAAMSEGRLPGLSQSDAELIRDELINRTQRSRHQGL